MRGIVVAVAAVLAGCLEGSGPAPTAPDAPPVCVLSAGACPAGCDIVPGYAVDPGARCIDRSAPITIGCAPPGTGAPRIEWCYTSPDGTLVWAPFQYEFGLDQAWRDCSIDVRRQIMSYPAC